MDMWRTNEVAGLKTMYNREKSIWKSCLKKQENIEKGSDTGPEK